MYNGIGEAWQERICLYLDRLYKTTLDQSEGGRHVPNSHRTSPASPSSCTLIVWLHNVRKQDTRPV